MKFYFIFLYVLISSQISIPQWEYQYPPVQGLLLSTDFVDSLTGVASGWQFELGNPSGRITYTRDGGNNWYLSNIPLRSRSITGIQMINNDLGYACGAYNLFMHNSTSKIFNTYEYNNINKYDPVLLNMIKYGLNPHRDDYNGIFLKTTNAGIDWNSIGVLPDSIIYLAGLSFLDSLTGYIASTSAVSINGKIFKTTDGGLSWVQQTFDEGVYFWNIEFNNLNQGLAVGYIVPSPGIYQGIIYWTDNGGTEWHKIIFPDIDNFNHLSFNSSNTAYVTGISTDLQSVVFKSSNGGESWELTSDTSAYEYFYDGIDFLENSEEGVLFGTRSIQDSLGATVIIPFIAKTTNGGTSWITISQFDSLVSYMVLGGKLVDESTWYLCGGRLSSSVIFKTTNGGVTFVKGSEYETQ